MLTVDLTLPEFVAWSVGVTTVSFGAARLLLAQPVLKRSIRHAQEHITALEDSVWHRYQPLNTEQKAALAALTDIDQQSQQRQEQIRQNATRIVIPDAGMPPERVNVNESCITSNLTLRQL